MKKTGFLAILALSAAAFAQDSSMPPAANEVNISAPQGTELTNGSFPFERVQAPTAADLYCAGFITKQLPSNTNYVAGGLDTPQQTKFVNGDMVYLTGGGYQTGQQYSIIRELKDPNRYEMFPGQGKMIRALGQPYSEQARVRVIDTRSKMAIAKVEFSCDPVVPGDYAIPFVEKAKIAFHAPVRFDRYLPASNKPSGRIVMAKDFDTVLGPGVKLYVNMGSNQGLKIGDHLRAVRTYGAVLEDSVDSISFKASSSEDTQKRQASIEPHMFTKTGGPVVHVRDLPRRSVGEVVVLGTTPTTATAMIVYALEDVHIGDGVELDEQ